MKKLFTLIFTLLLFISFMPTNNAKAEENTEDFQTQTSFSIPLYEDTDLLEYEEEPSDVTADDSANLIAPFSMFGKKKEIAKANFWVTESENKISYEVVMNKGYKFKSFSGMISTMDITSGMSQGRTQISGKSGSIFIAQYVGHAFRSTITGAVTSTDDYGYNINGVHLMWKYTGK